MAEQDVLDAIAEVLVRTNLAITRVNELKTLYEAGMTLEKICNHCQGTGEKLGWSDPQTGSPSCPDCSGTGYRPLGRSV